jgi:protein-tyrosine phosphatase
MYAGRNLADVPQGLVAKSALDKCADKISELVKDRFNVLVHCGAGIERSPLAVAWYLVKTGQSDNLDAAYKFLSSKRPQIQDRQQWIEP